jgi:2-isopropylmalate synthase
MREGAAIGDGPVDAVCKAISNVTRSLAKLVRYEIRAVTSGTEALGEVVAQLEQDGAKVLGRGASTDVIEASAKAYVDGLNQLANREAKRAAKA